MYLNEAPPVGVGLNKRAIITLKRCKPKSVQSLETLAALRGGEEEAYVQEKQRQYISKVRRYTERMGAKFLDLNLTTGDWTFEVEHFSTYRFFEDDDDDEELERELRARIQSAAGGKEMERGGDARYSEPSVGEASFFSLGGGTEHTGDGKEQITLPASDESVVSALQRKAFPAVGKLPEPRQSKEKESAWETPIRSLGEDSPGDINEVGAAGTSFRIRSLTGGRSFKRVSFFCPSSARDTDAGRVYAELFPSASFSSEKGRNVLSRKSFLCSGADQLLRECDGRSVDGGKDTSRKTEEQSLFQATAAARERRGSGEEHLGSGSAEECLSREIGLGRSDVSQACDSVVNLEDMGDRGSSSLPSSPVAPCSDAAPVVQRHCPYPVRCAPVISQGGLIALPDAVPFSPSSSWNSSACSFSSSSLVQIARVSPLLHADLDAPLSRERSRVVAGVWAPLASDAACAEDCTSTGWRKKGAERGARLWTAGEMPGEVFSSSEVEEEELERKALLSAVEDYILAQSSVGGEESTAMSCRGTMPSGSGDSAGLPPGDRAQSYSLSCPPSSFPAPGSDIHRGVVYAVDTPREQVRIFHDGRGVSRSLCAEAMSEVVTAFMEELGACEGGDSEEAYEVKVTQRLSCGSNGGRRSSSDYGGTGEKRAEGERRLFKEGRSEPGENSGAVGLSPAVKRAVRWWLITGVLKSGCASHVSSPQSSSQNSRKTDASLGSNEVGAGCGAVQRLLLRLLAFFERQHRSYCAFLESMTSFTRVARCQADMADISYSFGWGKSRTAAAKADVLLEASYLAPYMLQTWRLMIALMLEDPQHAASLRADVTRISTAFGPRVSAEAILERERQEKILDWLLAESAKDVRCFFQQAAQRSVSSMQQTGFFSPAGRSAVRTLGSSEGGSRRARGTEVDKAEAFQHAFRTGVEAEEAVQTAANTTDLEERKLLAVFHLAAAGQVRCHPSHVAPGELGTAHESDHRLYNSRS